MFFSSLHFASSAINFKAIGLTALPDKPEGADFPSILGFGHIVSKSMLLIELTVFIVDIAFAPAFLTAIASVDNGPTFGDNLIIKGKLVPFNAAFVKLIANSVFWELHYPY